MVFIPEELLRIARICYQCGECTGSCPLRRVSMFNPRDILYELATRGIDDDIMRWRWQCLICENCYNVCPQGVDFPSLIMELRSNEHEPVSEDLVAHRVLSQIAYFMTRFDKGVPVDFKGETDDNSEYGYFPGCLDYLDLFMDVGVNFHEIGDYALMLLNRIGIKPKLLDLKCCGHDVLFQGNLKVFQQLVSYNERKIKELGIKKLIVSCAEGYLMFRRYYKLEGVEVIHIAELLSERLHFPDAERVHNHAIKVAYHDPCALKRYKLYEEPRKAIKNSGAKLVELAHTRDSALCCGVSGMMNCNDTAKALRVLRLAEAEAKDVDILITTCPKCLSHFNCLKQEQEQGSESNYKFEIMDLVVFLGRLARQELTEADKNRR